MIEALPRHRLEKHTVESMDDSKYNETVKEFTVT